MPVIVRCELPGDSYQRDTISTLSWSICDCCRQAEGCATLDLEQQVIVPNV